MSKFNFEEAVNRALHGLQNLTGRGGVEKTDLQRLEALAYHLGVAGDEIERAVSMRYIVLECRDWLIAEGVEDVWQQTSECYINTAAEYEDQTSSWDLQYMGMIEGLGYLASDLQFFESCRVRDIQDLMILALHYFADFEPMGAVNE